MLRIGIFLLSFMVMTSCVKRDNINPVPTISYDSFSPIDEDNAYLSINYTDGDGNIFAEDGTKDNNFYAWYYYKDSNGQFQPGMWPIVIPNPPKPDSTIYVSMPLAYTIYRPSELSKNQPIKGKITVTLTGWRASVNHKNIKYRIYMIDQSGNKTAEIETPEIVTPF